MTLLTDIVVRALAERSDSFEIVNWSTKQTAVWKRSCVRVVAAMRTALRFAWGRRREQTLYYAASSGAGLTYDMVVLWVAWLKGMRIVLHHHVYSYITTRDWRMAAITRFVGTRGRHCVYCAKMGREFGSVYGIENTVVLTPVFPLNRSERPQNPNTNGLTLGFLSNITIEKGIEDVVATFERLRADGVDVKLKLAGPCASKEASEVVEAACRTSDAVEYLGSVTGRAKQAFFEEIDVFLFPTKYRNESFGIVITEALEYGCPVIANDRGCIPCTINGDFGLCVTRDSEFVNAAVERIERWLDAPDEFDAASRAARRRFEELCTNAEVELNELLQVIDG